MTKRHSVGPGLLSMLLLLPALSAHALDIDLPAETAAYRASDLPGYALIQRHCMICHSAQYVATQPPGTPRPYWDATVKKMRKPFGAQFGDDEIRLMVDYLSRTYGAERSPAPAVAPRR